MREPHPDTGEGARGESWTLVARMVLWSDSASVPLCDSFWIEGQWGDVRAQRIESTSTKANLGARKKGVVQSKPETRRATNQSEPLLEVVQCVHWRARRTVWAGIGAEGGGVCCAALMCMWCACSCVWWRSVGAGWALAWRWRAFIALASLIRSCFPVQLADMFSRLAGGALRAAVSPGAVPVFAVSLTAPVLQARTIASSASVDSLIPVRAHAQTARFADYVIRVL